MCITVEGRGQYVVVENLVVAAKSFKKVGDWNKLNDYKLGGYYYTYEYQFDEDGWAIPDNSEQEVDFVVEDTAGNTIMLKSFLDLGFHVKPPSFWCPNDPDGRLITAFVAFYTGHIQLVGVDSMVVSTFKVASIELLNGINFDKLYVVKDVAIEQQKRVLELVEKCGV